MGVLLSLGGHWPLKPYTWKWWLMVALALVIAATGLARRNAAQTALDA